MIWICLFTGGTPAGLATTGRPLPSCVVMYSRITPSGRRRSRNGRGLYYKKSEYANGLNYRQNSMVNNYKMVDLRGSEFLVAPCITSLLGLCVALKRAGSSMFPAVCTLLVVRRLPNSDHPWDIKTPKTYI